MLRGLRGRILVLILVALVPASALALHAARDRRESDGRATREETRRMARMASRAQRDSFESARLLLAVLARLPIVVEGDPAACGAFLASLCTKDGRYANLGVAGPDGMIRSSALPMTAPVDASDRSWFRRAVETRRPAIGEYQIGRITGKPTINVAHPIYDESGILRAVLFAALDLIWLQRLADRRDLAPGATILAVDAAGTVLVRDPDPDGLVGRAFPGHPLVRHIVAAREGTVESAGLDGTPRLYGFLPLNADGEKAAAFIAVGIPRAAAYAEADRALGRHLAGLGIVALLAGAAAWILGNRFVVRKCRRLLDVARRVTAGDLSARIGETKGRGEIDEVSRMFDTMIGALAQRQKAIEEAEARYHAIVEEIPAIVYVARADEDRVTLFVNSQAERLLGFPVVDWTADPAFWAKRLHAGDAEHARAEFTRSAAASAPFALEYRMTARDGRVLWVRDTAVPVAGEPRGYRGFLLDITEQKTLEQQFLQAQKMDALGRLAGGVAHDFNNLLTVVIGYGEMLLAQLPENHAMRGPVREILDAGHRGSGLTKQLLAFGRREELRVERLDLNDAIAGATKMLRRLIGEHIGLVHSGGKELAFVLADRGRVEQILMNLSVNARDAMPEGGTITIETANVELDEAYARLHHGVRPGPYVMLAISDTGKGMDAETRARLFEPFFTTKEKGKGTGLGLSTVYSVVQQHGGHVWVYSEPGHGTTFKIYFPHHQAAAPRTILVVEDEPEVRGFISATLRNRGYAVLEAGDGAEALRIVESSPGAVHLVVMDLYLPKLKGSELHARVVQLSPPTRFLFISGYTQNGAAQQGLLPPGSPFLAKPFAAEDLLAKTRTILDSVQ